MNTKCLLIAALISVVVADKFAIVFQGDTGYGNYSDSSNTCRAYNVGTLELLLRRILLLLAFLLKT